MQPDVAQARASARALFITLYFTAAVAAIAAIALALLISPAFLAIGIISIADLVIARLFARGVIGPLAAWRRAEASGDAAALAELDPTYNPYARED
jgi:hypothetical protein